LWRNALSLTPQGAGVIAAHWGMVDEALITSARARGLRVFGWTANEVRMIDPLITAGAAAIVTDKVRAACGVLAVAAAAQRCVEADAGMHTRRCAQPTLVQERIDKLRAQCGG
jgi:hypothetical protein